MLTISEPSKVLQVGVIGLFRELLGTDRICRHLPELKVRHKVVADSCQNLDECIEAFCKSRRWGHVHFVIDSLQSPPDHCH